MKDKIINVNSVGDFYVLEEIDYQNRKFVLCGKCDAEEDIDLNEFALFEVNIKNDDLIVNNVGEDVASTVTNLLLQKAKNNK